MAERCIVKILGSSATSFAALFYNSQKVTQGTAKCIAMRNFGDLGKYNIQSPVVLSNYFQKIADHNSMVKHKQKHMMFSYPGKPTEEEKTQFQKDIYQTMVRLGYEAQPMIFYEHNDTDNYHVHTVSVTVSVKDGMWIDNWQEGRRARRILDQLRGYNYKNEIDKLLDYKFESREQFKSLLLANGYRCHLDEENNTYDIYRNHDLVGSLLAEEVDERIATNGRNKDNFRDIVIDLRGKLLDNRRRSMRLKFDDPIVVTTKNGKHTITKKLSEVKNSRFNGEKGLDIEGERKAQFKQFLIDLKQKMGISLIFSQWKDGQTKGYTLIDNKNKLVFKGSDIVDLQKLLNPDWRKGQAKDAIISANDASNMADEISIDKNLPNFIEQQLNKLGIEAVYDKNKAMAEYGDESEQENRDNSIYCLNLLIDMVASQEDLTEEGEKDIRSLANEALARAVCADGLRMLEEERKARERAEEEARLSEQEKAQQRAEAAKTMTGDKIGRFIVDVLDDYNIRYNHNNNKYDTSMTEKGAIRQALNFLEAAIKNQDNRDRNANYALYFARCAEEMHKINIQLQKTKPVDPSKSKTQTTQTQPGTKQQPSAPVSHGARIIPFVKVEPTIFFGDDRRVYIKVDINDKAYQPKAISGNHAEWYKNQGNREQAAQDLALHYYASEIQRAQIEGWKEQHFEVGKMPFGITVGEIRRQSSSQGDSFWVDGDFYYNGKRMETERQEISRNEAIKYKNSDYDTAKSILCKSVGRELVKDWGFNPISEIKNTLFGSPAAEDSVEGVQESVQTFEAFTGQLCNDFMETCGEAAIAYFNAILPTGQSVGGGGGGQSTGNWGNRKDDDDWYKRGGGIMGFLQPKKKSGGPKR